MHSSPSNDHVDSDEVTQRAQRSIDLVRMSRALEHDLAEAARAVERVVTTATAYHVASTHRADGEQTAERPGGSAAETPPDSATENSEEPKS